MGHQRRCCICQKRPPWSGKNRPPGVCKRCYHREIWADRPAARVDRQAAAAAGGESDDDCIDDSADLSHDPDDASLAAHEPVPQLPPWPIRRVTAGMKRCAIPDAEEVGIFFGDLVSDEPNPWAEVDCDLNVKTAIQEALDGATPMFLIADSDGLTPHYGRVTISRGTARVVLWEGGGSVCDEIIAATTAGIVLGTVRERARRLMAAYPTRPDVEAELAARFGASADPWSPDPARQCKKHRSSPSVPRRCAACQTRREQVAATARHLRTQAARTLNERITAAADPADSTPEA